MEKANIFDEEFGISINIAVREEEIGGQKVFIVNNEELGVSDFGEDLDKAISNFRISARMYLDAYPEKKELIEKEQKKPLLVSRIFL